MVYSPTTWVDDTEPPINAANLNNIEQGILGAVAKTGDSMSGVLTMVDGSQVRNASGPATLAIDGSTWSGTYYKVGGNIKYFIGADNAIWKLSPFTDAGSEDSGKAIIFNRATGDVTIGGGLNMTSNYIYNLQTPNAAGDAANKGYVDARTPKITSSATAPSNPAVGDIWAGPM